MNAMFLLRYTDNIDAIIKTMLSIIGFTDAAANFPYEFNIPHIKLTNEIKIKYGNIIRDRVMVSLNLYGSLAKPVAIRVITFGINISNIKVISKSEYSSSEKIFLENFATDFSSLFTIWVENIGTNAALNAPSANISLKKLGNLKEVKNTSDSKSAPRYFAKNTSLIKPKTLDSSVKKLTIAVDFRNPIFI